jgi:hypothetical protein
MRKMILMLVAVAGLLVMLSGLWSLKNAISDTPVSMSCQEIIDGRGAGDGYVSIYNFLGCLNHFVYTSRLPGGLSPTYDGPYEEAVLPALPLDGPWAARMREVYEEHGAEGEFPLPEPESIRLLLRFGTVRNTDKLVELVGQHELRGYVSRADELDAETKRLLRRFYGEIDFRNVRVLNVGGPSYATAAFRILIGAGMIFGAGVGRLRQPGNEAWRRAAQRSLVSAGTVVPVPQGETGGPVTDQPRQPQDPQEQLLRDDDNNPYSRPQ